MSLPSLLGPSSLILDSDGEHGRVAHQLLGSCSSWWTEPNSGVVRSIFMNHYVFSMIPKAGFWWSHADVAKP